MDIKELIYKFVKEHDTKWCYETYLNKSIGLTGVRIPNDKKDKILRQYIENFVKENVT